jgi:hypothetical protein
LLFQKPNGYFKNPKKPKKRKRKKKKIIIMIIIKRIIKKRKCLYAFGFSVRSRRDCVIPQRAPSDEYRLGMLPSGKHPFS